MKKENGTSEFTGELNEAPPTTGTKRTWVWLLIGMFVAIALVGVVQNFAPHYRIFDGDTPVPKPATDDARLPSDLKAFIDQANFPNRSNVDVKTVQASAPPIRYFSLSYGAVQDCQSGCFRSNAIGLQIGEKFGWLKINNYDDSDDSFDDTLLTYYVVQKSDIEFVTLLSNTALRAEMKDLLAQAVAQSPESPLAALEQVVVSLEYSHSALGRLLIKHPTVRSNRTLLRAIADKPVNKYFPGDEKLEVFVDRTAYEECEKQVFRNCLYADVRSQALDLLGQL